MTSFQNVIDQLKTVFVSELPLRLDAIENLLLEMESTHDFDAVYEEVFRHVHSLKGTGGIYGFHVLSFSCHFIESNLETIKLKNDADFKKSIGLMLTHIDLMREMCELMGDHEKAFEGFEFSKDLAEKNVQLKKFSILIVERSKLIAGVISHILLNFKCKVVIVNDENSALAIVQKEHFDIIIASEENDSLSGYQMLYQLRNGLESTSETQTVLLTSNASIDYESFKPDFVVLKNEAFFEKIALTIQQIIGDEFL